MNKTKNLPKLIKQFREKNNLSQEQFARLIGVSNVSVYYYEQDRMPIPIILDRILQVINYKKDGE